MTNSKNYYKRVIDNILARIRAGTYRAGDQVPSTAELAQKLDMSKNTIVYAYDLMNALGYLETRAGKGTYVATGALSTLRTRHTLFTLPSPPKGQPTRLYPPEPPQKAIEHLKLKQSEAPLRYGRGFSGKLHELYYIHPQFEINMAPDGKAIDDYLYWQWGIPVQRAQYSIYTDSLRDELSEPLWIKAGMDIMRIEIRAYTVNMKPLYWGLQVWGLPLGITLDVVSRDGDMIIEQVNVNVGEEE